LKSTAEARSTYKNLTFVMQVFTEKLTPAYKAKAILLASKAQAEAEQGAEAGTDHEPEVKDESAQLLADLIESWKDGDGEEVTLHDAPFPPTYENLAQLSYPLLITLLKDVTTFLGAQANPPSAQS
jgi:hypothetical protein